MNSNEAMHILGVRAGDDKKEIRKKYRMLIAKVHPDNDGDKKNHPFTAAEVNAAYALLMKEEGLIKTAERAAADAGNKAEKKKKTPVWNAPENPAAYVIRPVYQYVHDADGETLGEICVARGKYYWILEEDFPLFLKSVYQTGKRLLEGIDEKNRRRTPADFVDFQARLTYLLTQQYIDSYESLKKLASLVDESKEGYTFRMKAMLEGLKKQRTFTIGEYILPKRVRDHRLYVQDMDGRELGYLSFMDDRLYWVIIPLFEARRVQIKMQAAEKTPARGKKYLSVDLWIRYDPQKTGTLPEDLNGQIRQVLADYSISS